MNDADTISKQDWMEESEQSVSTPQHSLTIAGVRQGHEPVGPDTERQSVRTVSTRSVRRANTSRSNM